MMESGLALEFYWMNVFQNIVTLESTTVKCNRARPSTVQALAGNLKP
jgi:hypothetical protein